MEIVSFYQSLKRYWRRRRYQRLDGASGKKNLRAIRLGGNTRRTWKLRSFRKLRLRLRFLSPLNILTRLRDAYVDAMLGMAGKSYGLQTSGTSVFVGKRIPQALPVKTENGKRFEERLLFEICKSIAASRELAAIRSME